MARCANRHDENQNEIMLSHVSKSRHGAPIFCLDIFSGQTLPLRVRMTARAEFIQTAIEFIPTAN
jgi:hypothetical protein